MNARQICAILLEDEPEIGDFVSKALAYTVKYPVFQAGSGPYGSGGWSRNARHRPQPQIVTKKTIDVKFLGKSIFVDGVRRLKANVWDAAGKPVRIDYPGIKLE